MSQTSKRAEDFLPHRDRMRLIDEIIDVNEKSAVTQATVTDQWPFFSGESVNSLVLIELVAQTAGISNCWEGIRKHGEQFVTKGWLVGIKQSHFHIHAIPLNTLITTRTETNSYLKILSKFLERSKSDRRLLLKYHCNSFSPNRCCQHERWRGIIPTS